MACEVSTKKDYKAEQKFILKDSYAADYQVDVIGYNRVQFREFTNATCLSLNQPHNKFTKKMIFPKCFPQERTKVRSE